MAWVDEEAHTINCKIVYYGPGLVGKTSSLRYLHMNTPQHRRSELRSICEETERTLFFDMADPYDRRVRGLKLRFHLYAVHGTSLYERTRVAVLDGADGVIYIADSRKKQLEENVMSLKEPARNLTKLGYIFKEFPLVLQYHRRDVPDILPPRVLDHYLNPLGWQRFESSLRIYWEGSHSYIGTGLGIVEAFTAVTDLMLPRL